MFFFFTWKQQGGEWKDNKHLLSEFLIEWNKRDNRKLIRSTAQTLLRIMEPVNGRGHFTFSTLVSITLKDQDKRNKNQYREAVNTYLKQTLSRRKDFQNKKEPWERFCPVIPLNSWEKINSWDIKDACWLAEQPGILLVLRDCLPVDTLLNLSVAVERSYNFLFVINPEKVRWGITKSMKVNCLQQKLFF